MGFRIEAFRPAITRCGPLAELIFRLRIFVEPTYRTKSIAFARAWNLRRARCVKGKRHTRGYFEKSKQRSRHRVLSGSVEPNRHERSREYNLRADKEKRKIKKKDSRARAQ